MYWKVLPSTWRSKMKLARSVAAFMSVIHS
jgi:hypothetical protein